MQTGVTYGSLNDATMELLKQAKALQALIENYAQQAASIGIGGADAWDGDAAEIAASVINKIKNDVTNLNNICRSLAERVNFSQEQYQAADASATELIQSVIG